MMEQLVFILLNTLTLKFCQKSICIIELFCLVVMKSYLYIHLWSAVLHTQWVCNTYLKVTVLLGPSPLLRLITYPLGPSRLLRGITYPLGPSPLLRLITYPLGPWPFRTGITYPLGPSLLHRKICEKIWLFYMFLSFKTVSDSPISIQQHIINKNIMLPTFHIHYELLL